MPKLGGFGDDMVWDGYGDDDKCCQTEFGRSNDSSDYKKL